MRILDIRTRSEYEAIHVCGAIHIETPRPPLSISARRSLLHRMAALNFPAGEPVAVYCAKGIRSKIAAGLLRQLGHEVIDLGGIEDEANFATKFDFKMCTSR